MQTSRTCRLIGYWNWRLGCVCLKAVFACYSTSMPAFLPFLLSSPLNLQGSNARLFHDGGVPARLDIRVNRFEKETQAVVLFPNNPIARESVSRYLAVLKSIYVRVSEGYDVAVAALRPGRSGSICAGITHEFSEARSNGRAPVGRCDA